MIFLELFGLGCLLVGCAIIWRAVVTGRGLPGFLVRPPDPYLRLRQRLADGEITEQEYLEREAALRDTAPRRRRLFR